MSDWLLIAAGYLFVFVGLGVYSTYVILRGRALSAKLPSDRRRFLG